MGRGDFPNLMRQQIRAAIECYRSTSLYHRNLGFFFVGILGGTIWGSYKRKANDATNADCAAVHLTFYNLPAALSQQQQGRQASSRDQTDRQLFLQRKRTFESLWEEAARLLQKQPGYTYTQMFRSLPPDEETQNTGLSNAADAELERHGCARKGVGAGIEAPAESDGTNQDQRAVDYVELRVWENEESRKKADVLQMPFMQKMQDLGVKLETGLYRRVFDDALIRLIQ